MLIYLETLTALASVNNLSAVSIERYGTHQTHQTVIINNNTHCTHQTVINNNTRHTRQSSITTTDTSDNTINQFVIED